MKKLIFFLLNAAKYFLLLPWILCSFPSCKKEVAAKPPLVVLFDNTPFKNVPDLNDMVVYEVNIRAFSAAGTFKGITARLDSIKALGVNVVWLMPIYKIGTTKGVGSPYCVADYKEINENFGNLTDLRNLIKAAHSKNMAVILDWVANHTSWDNQWITTHPEWYAQDADGNIISPPNTNWNDVAQLNYSNANMRGEMIKTMKYWISNANIDGFRYDAVDFVPTDFWKQAIDSMNGLSDRKIIMLAEGGKPANFSSGFKINYSWDFESTLTGIFKNNNSAGGLFLTDSNEYKVVPSGCLKLRYITNHDLSSNNSLITNFLSKEGSLAAFVITAYMRGVPLIYSGQEIAFPDKIPFLESFSVESFNWKENPDINSAYKKILQLRTNLTSVKRGSFKYYSNKDVVAFTRTLDAEKIYVIVNTRNSDINYLLPSEFNNTTWHDLVKNSTTKLSSTINLGPFNYFILKQ